MQLKKEYKKKNPYLIKKGKIFAKYHFQKKRKHLPICISSTTTIDEIMALIMSWVIKPSIMGIYTSSLVQFFKAINRGVKITNFNDFSNRVYFLRQSSSFNSMMTVLEFHRNGGEFHSIFAL